MTSAIKTKCIIVKGKVQGVYFRQSTKELAEQLYLTGNVANQKDGSVQIIATGTDGPLQQLVEWCHHGPSGASVKEVQVTDIPLKEFDTFQVVRAW